MSKVMITLSSPQVLIALFSVIAGLIVYVWKMQSNRIAGLEKLLADFEYPGLKQDIAVLQTNVQWIMTKLEHV